MNELCYTNIEGENEKNSLKVLQWALGCIIERVKHEVIISTFAEGDADLIMDTMKETAAVLKYNEPIE